MAANGSVNVAQPQPSHRPIDTLFPCLAVVLGETGKFFRNPTLHDVKHLNYTKGKLNKLIIGANQEFQDALDEIEIEILEAKAVMERDLTRIRTKRAERERAAAGLKVHSPNNQEEKGTDAAGRENLETMQMSSGESGEKSLKKIGTDDVIMANVQPYSAAEEKAGMEAEALHFPVHDGDEHTLKHKMNPAADDPVGLVASVEPTETAKEPKTPNPTVGEPTQPVPPPESPTVPDFEDVNFESMFTDSGTAGDNDQMDLDLGFNNDANTAQDFLNDSAFDSMTMSNDDAKNLNTTSNEDLNTLLPGLENYVNAGDDFSLAGIQQSNSIALPNPTGGIGTTGPAATTAPMEQAPIESNFDDFFASGNYLDGGGDDDMGGDGAFGDFDDSWFGTEVAKPDGS